MSYSISSRAAALALAVPLTAAFCSTAPDVIAAVPNQDPLGLNRSAPGRRTDGAPNVIVILWDDIGYAQFGCYGSPIATPNVDRLAARGLRYTDFHAAPVCSPTRAALLTGRNPHAVGVGCITEFANNQPNSRGGIAPNAGTLAAYLRNEGYSTYAVGKWHLTPMTDLNPAAPSDYWPTGAGFDHFYGFTSGGETNPWAPDLFHGRARIKNPPRNADGSPKHSEVDLTDHAIEFIAEQGANAPGTPFFLYLAYSAGHAPHHVSPEYLDKWRGRFDQGWDAVREGTLARQKALGIVPADVQLPPRNPGIKAWADLEPEERRLYARYYETFAAFVEHTDAQVGRLLDHLERTGQLDNTLIVLASDNGASPEGGPEGMWNEIRLFTTNSFDTWREGYAHIDALGSDMTYPTYPTGWTMAGSTPFRRQKGTAHMGGTRVPLIMHWPARISDAGGIRTQFHNVIDVLPTVLESVGVSAPVELAGHTQQRIDGTSMAYSWTEPGAPSRRTTQYVEIYGHRSIVDAGWKAVAFHPMGAPYENDAWELYDLSADFNEINDLAAAKPEKLAELLRAWEREAQANNVYPLDDRRAAREVIIGPDAPQMGTHFEFFPPVTSIHKAAAPNLRERSWKITAEFDSLSADSSGAIAAFGGRFAGWALYLLNGSPVFHYNYGGFERTTVASSDTSAPPAKTVTLEFNQSPDGGAEVILGSNGRELARGRVPRVLSIVSHETLDFGSDLITPVTEDYASPAVLTGAVLRKVTIDAAPYQH